MGGYAPILTNQAALAGGFYFEYAKAFYKTQGAFAFSNFKRVVYKCISF